MLMIDTFITAMQPGGISQALHFFSKQLHQFYKLEWTPTQITEYPIL